MWGFAGPIPDVPTLVHVSWGWARRARPGWQGAAWHGAGASACTCISPPCVPSTPPHVPPLPRPVHPFARQVLATIAWTASAHHAAVNFGQFDFASLLLNVSSLARRPIPRPGDEADPAYQVWGQHLAQCLPASLPSTWRHSITGRSPAAATSTPACAARPGAGQGRGQGRQGAGA